MKIITAGQCITVKLVALWNTCLCIFSEEDNWVFIFLLPPVCITGFQCWPVTDRPYEQGSRTVSQIWIEELGVLYFFLSIYSLIILIRMKITQEKHVLILTFLFWTGHWILNYHSDVVLPICFLMQKALDIKGVGIYQNSDMLNLSLTCEQRLRLERLYHTSVSVEKSCFNYYMTRLRLVCRLG